MSNNAEKIVVAGDVTIDWLQWPVEALEGSEDGGADAANWRLYPGMRMAAVPGGALLLARWMRDATDATVLSAEVSRSQIDHLTPVRSERLLRSLAGLKEFPRTAHDKQNRVFRVDRTYGYDAGPGNGDIVQLPVKRDVQSASIVLLDDAGDGFRSEKTLWPKSLTSGKEPLIVLKKSRPLWQGDLWQLLLEKHPDRLVVIVSADDLRQEGADISRRLSWERTAKDMMWQLASNPELRPLAECRNLIVRLDLDGAIHYRRDGEAAEARLYYDPALGEGGFDAQYAGEMIGLASAFAAALTARILREGLDGIGEGVREGILSSRRLLQYGFGDEAEKIDYPGPEIFKPSASDSFIADISIPSPSSLDCADEDYWTILEELVQSQLEEVAFNTVTRGSDSQLDRVPVGQFGKLKTLDRKEIEGYRCIENLMVQYLSEERQKRPLSIAVFGPPGSGKSFGVEQIAKSVSPGTIESSGLEFNLSQFTSLKELVGAFHRVRDTVLEGKVPLVFFDEFDSSFDGDELGWLKYFLDPMQSGRFKEGEHVHPIGKAIFVFAGATSSSLKEFSREDGEAEDRLLFRKVKGTDFVSRLRGYVDILGPNPLDDEDRLCMIRRAVLLRSLLQMKAGSLFDRAGRLQIDSGVLRAMIKVPEYKHGVRSMESILDMSTLSGRRYFEQSAIPSPAQLELHVPADIFCRLMKRDVIFGGARERLAEAIHETYRESGSQPAGDRAMKPWAALDEDLKESNRRQADSIPDYLASIGYGFVPSQQHEPEAIKFTTRQIEKLAREEHDRWAAEKRLAGWTYGPVKDAVEKTHPCLVDWEELSVEEREKDARTVGQIPKYLAMAGFEVHKLGEK